ncbi:hypothetical protein GCM10009678_06840 [Actinomadura kijaniata]|uniref:Uncharacterized protein n=1 Tax=Actinomadura namibiensis TaxID=182080 RepID=A0A7W3QKF8_ACTNM|nr:MULTISPECIES: hypothetical protein [Actinomadura]MBA8950351.1 hypothetical protein [Actinomadura namibiensis]
MRVRDVQVITEKWYFYCMNCLCSWQRDFEARHCDDGHGGDHVVWRLNGHAALPPWVDPLCPTCQGFQVKAFPGGPRGLVPAQR